MLLFSFIFSFLLFFFEFNPLILVDDNPEIIIYRYFLAFFIFFLFLNYVIYDNNEIDTKYMNVDLVFKYLILLLKTPNFLLNFIIIVFKKIYLYIIHFKYRYFIKTIDILLKLTFKNFFIYWKPLFKKSSYFSYYRSNRSKWIK